MSTATPSKDLPVTTRAHNPPSPSPLDAVVADAARKLMGLKMTKLYLEPEQEDVDNILSDLDAICHIIDPVVRAIGQYAVDYFGMKQSNVHDYFTDQLRGTLDGNGTYIIQAAFDAMLQDRADAQIPYWERR